MVESAELALDTLRGGALLTVDVLAGLDVGGGAAAALPHRHDYHELIWMRGARAALSTARRCRCGRARSPSIGRGAGARVRARRRPDGAVVRFGDELLSASRRADAGLARGRARRPHGRRAAGRAAGARGADRALAAEARRPPDPLRADLQRHLLTVVLLWLERWYDAARTERRERRRRRRAAAPPLRRACWSATSPATTTPATTPTRSPCRPRRCRRR